jgi:hypothetical protein
MSIESSAPVFPNLTDPVLSIGDQTVVAAQETGCFVVFQLFVKQGFFQHNGGPSLSKTLKAMQRESPETYPKISEIFPTISSPFDAGLRPEEVVPAGQSFFVGLASLPTGVRQALRPALRRTPAHINLLSMCIY